MTAAENMIEPSAFSSDTTQRPQSDGELLRQRSYLDELFELAPDAVVLTTIRNPRILRVNREFTRIFGYTSDEAVGNCLRDMIMPDSSETILPEDPELLAGRKAEREGIRRRKDGTRFHAHVTGKRIQLSDDDDAAFLIFRDISERKRAEALLAAEKRLLEIIATGSRLETTLDALCRLAEEVDPNSLTSILLLDRKANRLRKGAGPSLPSNYVNAIDGAAVGLGIGPCAAAAHLGQQVISLDLAADERWSDEMRALASAHRLHTCWSTPIKSAEGRVLGTFAIYPSEAAGPTPEQKSRIEQLTHLASIAIERADSIEALHDSEKRYERAMLAAEAGFWDWDVLKDEFYVSPRLLDMCGFPPGTTFASREDFIRGAPFYPEDRDKWQQAVKELFASGGSRVAMDLRSLHDGDTVWNRLDGMCFRDELGHVVRWTGSATDVTERKRAEEALRRSEAALRVSEERYALALEASEEGHFDIDLQAGEIFVSARVNEIYGFPAEAKTLNRKEFLELIPFHPDDRLRVLAEVSKQGWDERNLQEIQCRILLRSGETRWIRSRAKVVRDAQGRARRRVGVLADITERKRAEEALREQTERLQLGQTAMRMIIMDWNVTEDLLTWSDSPEWLRGPMPATGHYPPFKDQIHPEDRDRFLDTRRRALETLEIQTNEFRLVRTDGEALWVLERKHAFADAEGKPVRMLAAMFDITERKRAEDELRESEARFRALTALWSDWYWRQDETLRFTYSTAATDPPDGYPGGSAIGKTRWELPGIVPLSSSWAEHQAKLEAHEPFREFEYCRPGLDGTMRYVSTSGTPIFDDKGQFRGYHGVARNITDRKKAEEELRSRQEMLDLAQWAARAVAFEWRIDAAKGENRWSPDLEAMYGIPSGSYDGTYESWKKLVHPEDWPNVRAAIKLAQQTGDVDAEYRVLHPGGAVRWLHAKGRMLFDSEHKPARIVGFMLDVTDRHLGAEELQRMERQLRQAQRLEALGTLAGGIAHDFNNLLGAILGYGEMALRNVRAGTRLRRDIESMMIAGERGHALVERILAFSRSGVGERVAVHVEGVVRETLALLAAKLPPHIVIERRLHGGSAAVMGDPTQIHQVLMNLVTNAIQAMPSGGTLRVSLDRIHLQAPRVATTGSVAAREYVVVEVSDSGSGIPSEIFEKIFDPFFTTKEVGVGTGLGLSLVHGIVMGLGGAIDVVTAVGKGSVFKVYLPLAGEVTVPIAPKKRLAPKVPRGIRGRILVIDDEEPLVRLVTETLAESGYLPSSFTSSTKALQAFLADPKAFAAVITDESMPGMSGSDLIRKMRALTPTIPILLVSGYLGTTVIERAREAGATEVLKKPLSASVLRKALERVLPPAKAPRSKVPESSNPPRPGGRPPRTVESSHTRPVPVRRARSMS